MEDFASTYLNNQNAFKHELFGLHGYILKCNSMFSFFGINSLSGIVCSGIDAFFTLRMDGCIIYPRLNHSNAVEDVSVKC